jgi:hypothetical protein
MSNQIARRHSREPTKTRPRSAQGSDRAPQAVVTRFAPIKKGQSARLRLSETYTAP